MRNRGGTDDEDVLASIRRLVQAELGSLGEPPSGMRGAARRAEVPDALVLTPALRVSSERAAPQAGAHRPAASPPQRPAEKVVLPPRERPAEVRRRTLEERIAELEAAVDPRQPSEWEPDGSEDQGQHAPNAVILSHPRARRRPSRPTGPSTEALAQRARALSGEGAAERDEGQGGDRRVVGFGRRAAPDESRAPERTPRADQTPREAAQTPRETQPSAAGDVTRPAQGVRPPSLADMIDEAMIREIVAEVVREELRGRLGERITRNVRKLVRSEIRRILATDGRL